MNLRERTDLLAVFTEAIDETLLSHESSIRLPYLGENLAALMATAAVSVLEAVADTQDYFDSEGMLNRDA